MFKTALVPSLLIAVFAVCGSTVVPAAAQIRANSSGQLPVSIKAGQTQLFRFAAGNPSTITWYVNSIAGGNPLVGKVTSSGVYTAPAIAPDADIVLSVVDSSDNRTSLVARIKVLDDPAILEAHQKWIDGAAEAAAIYGCVHPIIQQDATESVAEALKVYLLTADKSSCLILSPISADPGSNRYSYAWGGNVDGVDIYYISDVSRPRILLGNPLSGE